MRPLLLKFLCLMMPGLASAQDHPVAASAANNSFAFDMYKALPAQKGAVFFSPYSIFTALQMTADGARGNTAAEMQQVLHTTGNIDSIHSEIKKSRQRYDSLSAKGDIIQMANSLWVEKSLPLNPVFVTQSMDWYNASLQNVDFMHKADSSRLKINNWVEERTDHRIKDLLDERAITPDTRMVLINTILLKAKWSKPFKQKNTRPDTFFAPGQEMKIPFMNCTDPVYYAEDETMQLIELPYQSKELSMLVMLPIKGKEDDFSKKFSWQMVERSVNNLALKRTSVSLPKFKMNAAFSLKKVLMELGITKAFAPGADFSGMSKQDLLISDVIHKAFIEVNEDGTEAAAGTAVTVMARSIAVTPEPDKVFKADHPFIFFLFDRESKTILFMGRMDKPE